MYLGIDIGGTAVKYGVVDEETLEILEKDSFPTPKDSGEAVIDRIAEVCAELMSRYEVTSIGIGSPGYVDSRKGIISEADNLPNICGLPIVDTLRERLNRPVFIGNDANCAALGEYAVGGGDAKNSVMITLGTGVGGGIIVNGALYGGANGYAGELGHMVIVKDGLPCGCGRRGCFECYASATALVRMTKKTIEEEPESLMAKGVAESGGEVDGRTVFEYIKRGCKTAEKALDEYADYLATGIDDFVELLYPDEIVLAGGITNDADILFPAVNRHYSGRVRLRIAALKSNAGLVGAAVLGKYTKG